MHVNCDILRYFLSRHQWKTEIFRYDSATTVDLIRYYDGVCAQEHALFILDETASLPAASNQASRPLNPFPGLAAPGKSCILLCILPPHPPESCSPDSSQAASCVPPLSPDSRWIAALSCPILCVYTDHSPALLNEIQDIFENVQAHRQALEQLCLHSHSYQALIDCCDDLLEEPVSLIDQTFTYVAYSREKSEQKGYVRDRVENGRVASQLAAQLMSTPGFELLEKKRGVFEFEDDYYFVGRNIFSEDTYVGRLIIMYAQDFTQNSYQKYILECLGTYVERMYQRQGGFFFHQEMPLLLHALLPGALSGQPVKNSDWRRALEQKGWNFTDSCRLMSFYAAYRSEKQIHPDYLCPQLESRWPWVVAAAFDGEAVVLINQSRVPDDFEQQLAYFVRDNLLTAGISRCFRDAAGLEAAWRQTKIAARIGLRLAPHLWYYFFDHYTLDYLREQCLADLPPEVLCHPALALLREYDEQHGTELYRSLYIFMDSRYNMSQASERMFVHRTTFIKRIEQIQKLTGLDLTHWETRMYLMLSYQWMG